MRNKSVLITTKGGRQKCKIKANIKKKKRKTAEGELKKKVICVSATKKKIVRINFVIFLS